VTADVRFHTVVDRSPLKGAVRLLGASATA